MITCLIICQQHFLMKILLFSCCDFAHSTILCNPINGVLHVPLFSQICIFSMLLSLQSQIRIFPSHVLLCALTTKYFRFSWKGDVMPIHRCAGTSKIMKEVKTTANQSFFWYPKRSCWGPMMCYHDISVFSFYHQSNCTIMHTSVAVAHNHRRIFWGQFSSLLRKYNLVICFIPQHTTRR